MPLDYESSDLTVISTFHGFYNDKLIPFGLWSDPSIFQNLIDRILKDINHVTCFIGDVIVTGKTHEENLMNLQKVLELLNCMISLQKKINVYFS